MLTYCPLKLHLCASVFLFLFFSWSFRLSAVFFLSIHAPFGSGEEGPIWTPFLFSPYTFVHRGTQRPATCDGSRKTLSVIAVGRTEIRKEKPTLGILDFFLVCEIFLSSGRRQQRFRKKNIFILHGMETRARGHACRLPFLNPPPFEPRCLDTVCLLSRTANGGENLLHARADSGSIVWADTFLIRISFLRPDLRAAFRLPEKFFLFEQVRKTSFSTPSGNVACVANREADSPPSHLYTIARRG